MKRCTRESAILVAGLLMALSLQGQPKSTPHWMPPVWHPEAELRRLAEIPDSLRKPHHLERTGDCLFALSLADSALKTYHKAISLQKVPNTELAIKFLLVKELTRSKMVAHRHLSQVHGHLIHRLDSSRALNAAPDPFGATRPFPARFDTLIRYPEVCTPHDEFVAAYHHPNWYYQSRVSPKAWGPAPPKGKDQEPGPFRVWPINRGHGIDFGKGQAKCVDIPPQGERLSTAGFCYHHWGPQSRDPYYLYTAIGDHKRRGAGLSSQETHLGAAQVKNERVRTQGTFSLPALPFGGQMRQPAIHPLGKLIVFVGDSPYNLGGADLYYCRVVADSLTTPRPIGTHINTTHDEIFPTFSLNGDLYFSSDGHGGYGKHDILRCTYDSTLNIWSSPQNVGSGVNSPWDEFSMVWSSQSEGQVASNRPGGAGGSDIYTFRCSRSLLRVQVEAMLGRPFGESVPYLVVATPDTLTGMTNEDGLLEIWLKAKAKGYVQLLDTSDTGIQHPFDFTKWGTTIAQHSGDMVVNARGASFTVLRANYKLRLPRQLPGPPQPARPPKPQDFPFTLQFFDGKDYTLLAGASIAIMGQDSTRPYQQMRMHGADTTLSFNPDVFYRFLFTKPGYRPISFGCLGQQLLGSDSLSGMRIFMYQGDYLVVKGTLRLAQPLHKDAPNPLAFAKVYPVQDRPYAGFKNFDETYTDANGSFIFILPWNKDHTYSFHAAPEGFLPVRHSLKPLRKGSIGPNDTIQLPDFIFDGGTTLAQTNVSIRYRSGRSGVDLASEQELDRIVFLIHANPGHPIEVYAHTDAKGSAEHNLALSKKRGEQVVQYLRNQLTSNSFETTFTLYPMGESQPVNGCIDGVPCSKIQHQENRRAVIRIGQPSTAQD